MGQLNQICRHIIIFGYEVTIFEGPVNMISRLGWGQLDSYPTDERLEDWPPERCGQVVLLRAVLGVVCGPEEVYFVSRAMEPIVGHVN